MQRPLCLPQAPETSLFSHYEEKVRPCIDLIDSLRALGVEQDLALPAIAVIGDQSSGKSSVLEALSGVALPRGSGKHGWTGQLCPLWTAGRLQAAEWARGTGGVGHRPPGRASEGGSRRPQTAWVRVLGLRGQGRDVPRRPRARAHLHVATAIVGPESGHVESVSGTCSSEELLNVLRSCYSGIVV